MAAADVNIKIIKDQMILLNTSLQTFTDKLLYLQKFQVKQNKDLKNYVKTMKGVSTQTEKASEATERLSQANAKIKKYTTNQITGQRQYNTVFGKFHDILTSTSEDVKIFGIHAASARRFMYGFLPPGIFRMVNKFATAFGFLDISIRQMKGGLEETNEEAGDITRTFIKVGMAINKVAKMSGKDIGKSIIGKRKATQDKIDEVARKVGGTMGTAPLTKEQLKADKKKLTELLGRGQNTAAKQKEVKMLRKRIVETKKFRKEQMRAIKKQALRNGKIAGFVKKLKMLPMVLKSALLAFGKILLFILGITFIAYFLYKTVYPYLKQAFENAYPAIQEAFALIFGALEIVWSGFQDIWSAFFGDGDLTTLIDGVLKVVSGLVLTSIAVISVALYALGVLAVELLKGLWQAAKDYLSDWRSGLISPLTKIATIVAVLAGGVAFFLSGAWAGLIAAGIGFYLVDKIGGMLGMKAEGGVIDTPLTIVGEKGPELLVGNQGSTVISNANSRKALGGTVNNFNITINARDTSDAELRRIADKIGRMVNNKVTRSVSTTTTI